ncbi:AGAP005269-PA [Anopheles gambiae str. PEST]|uniref:AGAP005269-PA n=1 Tax=Anopheles gambiae TaxID=7165 RepID=Q5TWD0_ANOGA|nr:AGAP005269-PA [Anopheles gambiae str. PEST]
MERFSINILRQQVYNICRLCGVDNPDKIAILSEEEEDVILVTEDEEPSLAKKIEECVGIRVHANDQMPQNVCTLCVDKVNDFYEYRLMCASTNLQTRSILNLPVVNPSISLVKSEVRATPELPPDEDTVDTKPSLKRGPKTRNRKKQDAPGSDEPGSSEDADTKPFQDGPTEKRVKFEFACQYCNEAYSQSTELERHLVVKHTPLIHKFGCGACMEYFDTASEYKDHNLWHKLSRTTFSCFRCNRKFVKVGTLNKHIETNSCVKGPRTAYDVALVPDMSCTLCNKVFKTRNLYEWHGCFMRARASCPKCGKHFVKKNLLLRHYMLYCTGTLPLIEPAFLPKIEPGPLANGLMEGVAARGTGLPPGGTSTEVKRRGRPTIREKMKEETLELPLSPSMMMDSPDAMKSETNSIADADETHDNGMEGERKRLKSTLVEETDKITTLLRSGATVDGNSDIATINSMLSSVNEAIATISKVRKKKKKRDRSGSTSAADKPPGDTACQPMVVLSMANVKQEALDDSSLLASLTNSAGVVPNGMGESEPAPADDGRREMMEGEEASAPTVSHYDTDMGDTAEDNFDHHGNDGNASDTESVANNSVEVINLDSSDEEDASSAARNTHQPNHTRSQAAQSAESIQPTTVQMVAVKQEQHTDGESDFEGYADASEYVMVKQEPSDETDANETVPSADVLQSYPDSSYSPYQALRIKIKKEKGLLNASVVGEESAPSQVATTPPTTARKHSSPGEGKTKKASKPATKRNTVQPPPPVVDAQPEPIAMEVRIKQEPVESYDELQPHASTDGSPFDSTVRIKQEPQDEFAPSTHNEPPADIVAFDGTRIKRERVDNGAEKAQPPSSNGLVGRQDPSRKALNPLSLTGVRLSGGKKSSPSGQSSASASGKPNVMINPFALLKQKSSVSATAEGQESAAKESAEEPAERQEDRYALPVISQVKSIDPKDHTSSLAFEASPEPSKALEQEQVDTAAAGAADNSRDTCLADDGSASLPEAVVNSVPVPAAANVSELKIASVASIPHAAEGCAVPGLDKSECEPQPSAIEAEASDDNTVHDQVNNLPDLQATQPVSDVAERASERPDHLTNHESDADVDQKNETETAKPTIGCAVEPESPVSSTSPEEPAQVVDVHKNETESRQPTVESELSHPVSSASIEDATHADESENGAENGQPTRDCDEEAQPHPVPGEEHIPDDVSSESDAAPSLHEAKEQTKHEQPSLDCGVETQPPLPVPSPSVEDIPAVTPSNVASDAALAEEDDTNESIQTPDCSVSLPVASQSVENIRSAEKEEVPVEDVQKDEQTNCETETAEFSGNQDSSSELATEQQSTTTSQQPEQQQHDSSVNASETTQADVKNPVERSAETDHPETQPERHTVPSSSEVPVVK